MVTVTLKRKISMKNYHKMGLIRPQKIYEALLYLKENHPEYKDIKITECEEWLSKWQSEKDENISEADSDEIESSDESCTEQLDESTTELSNKRIRNTKNESGDNEFNSVTCLIPEDPLCDVIGKFFIPFLLLYSFS